jgi:catechol 2,3-dioxygenase-like lactoylglutathione lyase family enzyme
MDIKFISVVLFVKDIQVARRFYEGILDQKVTIDHGLNVEYEGGGFSLWQRDHAHGIIFQQTMPEPPDKNNNAELYFETNQVDELCQRLDAAGVEWIHPITEQPWGQRVARLYDPDGNVLEVGDSMNAAIARFIERGLTLEEIAQRTAIPVEIIRQMANG